MNNLENTFVEHLPSKPGTCPRGASSLTGRATRKQAVKHNLVGQFPPSFSVLFEPYLIEEESQEHTCPFSPWGRILVKRLPVTYFSPAYHCPYQLLIFKGEIITDMIDQSQGWSLSHVLLVSYITWGQGEDKFPIFIATIWKVQWIRACLRAPTMYLFFSTAIFGVTGCSITKCFIYSYLSVVSYVYVSLVR